MALLPFIPRIRRKCRRWCRKKGGCHYDDLVEKRTAANLITTYDPREHTRYRSAFKLIDLAANYNVDAHGDDSDTESSEEAKEDSESEGEEHDEHHKALLAAAAIIGKTPVGKNEAIAREEAMLAKLAEAQLLPMPGATNFKPTLTLLGNNKAANHESLQVASVTAEGGMAGGGPAVQKSNTDPIRNSAKPAEKAPELQKSKTTEITKGKESVAPGAGSPPRPGSARRRSVNSKDGKAAEGKEGESSRKTGDGARKERPKREDRKEGEKSSSSRRKDGDDKDRDRSHRKEKKDRGDRKDRDKDSPGKSADNKKDAGHEGDDLL